MPAILVAGVFVGGALAGRPEPPAAVADGVTLQPAPDWQFAGRFDDPDDGDEGVVFTRGSATMFVYTNPLPIPDELADLASELSADPIRVGERRPVTVGSRSGERFSFTGSSQNLSASPLEGEATAVRGSAVTLVFVAWADVGAYDLVRAEVDSMIQAAVLP